MHISMLQNVTFKKKISTQERRHNLQGRVQKQFFFHNTLLLYGIPRGTKYETALKVHVY